MYQTNGQTCYQKSSSYVGANPNLELEDRNGDCH